MSDGSRTFTITMTNAQYDVLKHAVEQILDDWKKLGLIRASDRHTLMRAMTHLDQQFETGTRK